MLGQVTDTTDSVDLTALRAVAALSDEQRRRLYRFARTARRPVSREEAATAVGISRKLAAFHLEKLVQAGMLRHHVLPSDGSRVGRRPKVYEPTDARFEVSIPARRHQILADILVQAVLTESAHGSARAAASTAAYQRGFAAGTDLRERLHPGRLGAERALTIMDGVLVEHGFEPARANPGCIRLRNCPFHPLAHDAPELVCGLNHALIRGLIDGLHADTIKAILAPTAGECCVELRVVEKG
jgi:predicted ArsR family transcriptional regulator